MPPQGRHVAGRARPFQRRLVGGKIEARGNAPIIQGLCMRRHAADASGQEQNGRNGAQK
jgi:hypothetical protein